MLHTPDACSTVVSPETGLLVFPGSLAAQEEEPHGLVTKWTTELAPLRPLQTDILDQLSRGNRKAGAVAGALLPRHPELTVNDVIIETIALTRHANGKVPLERAVDEAIQREDINIERATPPDDSDLPFNPNAARELIRLWIRGEADNQGALGNIDTENPARLRKQVCDYLETDFLPAAVRRAHEKGLRGLDGRLRRSDTLVFALEEPARLRSTHALLAGLKGRAMGLSVDAIATGRGVTNSTQKSQISQAIDRLRANGTPQAITKAAIAYPELDLGTANRPTEPPTEIELRVAACLTSGMHVEQTGNHLGMDAADVKDHRQRLMVKLGVHRESRDPYSGASALAGALWRTGFFIAARPRKGFDWENQ